MQLSQKKVKKSLFDIDSDENDYQFTHNGEKLEFNEDYKDDLIDSASEDYESSYNI